MSPAPLPGVLAGLSPVLHHYGYLAVAGFIFFEDFGVPLPGETVLIAAAVYAGAGRLSIAAVAVVAVLAAVLGDNVGYGLRYVFLTGERLDRAGTWFGRHGGKIVTVARFVEGLRQANGIVAGLTGMRWARFVVFNALGAMLWVAVWSSADYSSGNHIGAVYGILSHGFLYLAAAAALLLAVCAARGARAHRPPAPAGAPHDSHPREPGQASVTGPGTAQPGNTRPPHAATSPPLR